MKFNQCITCKDIDEAWLYWYNLLSSMKLTESSRDGGIAGEVINAQTVLVDPTKNIMKNDVRKLPMRYAIGEMLWYLSGNRELKEIQKYTSGWDRMTDDGVYVNSNYGWCIKHKYGFDQWEFVKAELRKNPNSRRAVIHIKTADNTESKDVNCTCTLQFFIRDGKLYMITYMRSNDIWMGFPYDIFQFTNMQVLMSMELGVKLGTYTHIAGSLHLYERDIKNASDDK